MELPSTSSISRVAGSKSAFLPAHPRLRYRPRPRMTLLNMRILPLLSAGPRAEAASGRAAPRTYGSRLVARYGWPNGFPTEKTREAAGLQRLPPQNLPAFCQHGLDPK